MTPLGTSEVLKQARNRPIPDARCHGTPCTMGCALATDLLSYFPQPCIVLWRRNKIIRQISRAWSLRGGGRVEDGFFHLQDLHCFV